MHIMYRTAAVLFLLHAWLSAPSCPAAERWSPYCINEGEGGQVIVSIAVSKSDPDFVMFGTDVGGLYRSTDGGAHWIATGAGFDALTGLDIAIDPGNADHVLVVGSAPAAGRYCGVYRSADKGVTWTQVLADDKIHDIFDRRGNHQLVIDGVQLRCVPRVLHAGLLFLRDGCLLHIQRRRKQLDEGSGSGREEPVGDQFPHRLALCSARQDALPQQRPWRMSFQTVFTTTKTIGALDATDDVVVLGINTDGKVYVSTDNGDSFKPKASQGIPAGEKRRFASLRASPAKSTYMMAFIEGADHPKFVSHDGGDHWTTIDVSNMRHSIIDGVAGHADVPFAWHPSDANVCWEARHDFMTKSTRRRPELLLVQPGIRRDLLGPGRHVLFQRQQPRSPGSAVGRLERGRNARRRAHMAASLWRSVRLSVVGLDLRLLQCRAGGLVLRRLESAFTLEPAIESHPRRRQDL